MDWFTIPIILVVDPGVHQPKYNWSLKILEGDEASTLANKVFEDATTCMLEVVGEETTAGIVDSTLS